MFRIRQEANVTTSSTMREVSVALACIARVEAPQAGPWRPKLAAALASLAAAGDTTAAAAAERLQRCALRLRKSSLELL